MTFNRKSLTKALPGAGWAKAFTQPTRVLGEGPQVTIRVRGKL